MNLLSLLEINRTSRMVSPYSEKDMMVLSCFKNTKKITYESPVIEVICSGKENCIIIQIYSYNFCKVQTRWSHALS
jgi:hypothetical protein